MNFQGGNPKTLTIGGHTFEWDPANNPNDISLNTLAAGANSKASGRKGAATSGYQVPAGKTLYLLALKVINLGSAPAGCYVAQADNDSGMSGTTGPVNPVFLGGTSGVYVVQTAGAVGATTEIGGLAFPVATGKYLTTVAGGTETAYFQLYGKLV